MFEFLQFFGGVAFVLEFCFEQLEAQLEGGVVLVEGVEERGGEEEVFFVEGEAAHEGDAVLEVFVSAGVVGPALEGLFVAEAALEEEALNVEGVGFFGGHEEFA